MKVSQKMKKKYFVNEGIEWRKERESAVFPGQCEPFRKVHCNSKQFSRNLSSWQCCYVFQELWRYTKRFLLRVSCDHLLYWVLCGLICNYPQELYLAVRCLFLNTIFMSHTTFKLWVFSVKFVTGFPEPCFA